MVDGQYGRAYYKEWADLLYATKSCGLGSPSSFDPVITAPACATFARPLAPHKDRSPIIFVRKRPSRWKCSINTSIT